MRTATRPAAALAALLLAVGLAACADPKDPAGWAERAASRNRLDEKLAALTAARAAPGDRKAAVKPLSEVLGQAPKARALAAVILGETGDPAAIPALVKALDTADRPERDVNEANVAIAGALGALQAREAVPVLSRLAVGSRDAFTQIAAIDALGAIGDPAAVDALLAVAGNDQAEPFAVKKALLALGRLGDPRAVPTVVRMLYADRPGGTFFPDAAFAASQLGAPMSAPLVAVVQGRDPDLASWAAQRGVHPAALRAKAAQLLGDVGGPEAVPALLSALGYVDAEPGPQLVVRVFAAESLGRLHAREAVAPVAALLARERDPDARERLADALARIGDPAALPALRAAAAAAGPEQAEGLLDALTRLGGEADRPALAAAQQACGAGCPATRRAALEGMAARLDAAAACEGKGAACWAARLADPRAEVRDRAALEVGRAGGAAEAAALGQALVRRVDTDADLAARFHAVLALDAIARRQPLGPKGAELATAIDAMLLADKGRSLTASVNEDALRLAGRLRKAAR